MFAFRAMKQLMKIRVKCSSLILSGFVFLFTLNVSTSLDASSYTPNNFFLMPCEIHMDSLTRAALKYIRDELKRKQQQERMQEILHSSSETNSYHMDSNFFRYALRNCYFNSHYNDNSESQHQTRTSGDSGIEAITLTFCGWKGGNLQEQVNQDRAFVVAKENFVLSGVLDGHGETGELVAEWSRSQILNQLLQEERLLMKNSNNVPEILTQTVLQTDSSLPDYIAMDGGATVSLVAQQQVQIPITNDNQELINVISDTMIYFCNAGDSQSFLAASIILKNINNKDTIDGVHTYVLFETRLDKPDLPEERARIEQIPGMKVGVAGTYDEGDNLVRVWYKSHYNGHEYGLAMSRGLGDREAIGVIAEPTITTFRKQTIKEHIIHQVNTGLLVLPTNNDKRQVCVISDPMTGTCDTSFVTDSVDQQPLSHTQITEDNVELFVVSATDGVLDFVSPHQIAQVIGPSLYDRSNRELQKQHLAITTEDILTQAGAGWHKENRGYYRDDMAIAITKVI